MIGYRSIPPLLLLPCSMSGISILVLVISGSSGIPLSFYIYFCSKTVKQSDQYKLIFFGIFLKQNY
jgi:hypothetical protein